ncbi:hypothetical protein NPIL_300891, partial [Nephila pilipes]
MSPIAYATHGFRGGMPPPTRGMQVLACPALPG